MRSDASGRAAFVLAVVSVLVLGFAAPAFAQEDQYD
jgi:hypothetical protein